MIKPDKNLFCPKCKHEVYGGIETCQYCGSKTIPIRIFNPNILFCKKCKNGIDGNLSACPHCGEKRNVNEGKKTLYDYENFGKLFLKISLWSIFLFFLFLLIIDSGGAGCSSNAIKVRLSY